ncbi:MAG: flagellar hook-associated protein FlgK [Planctomycetota bacterium]
MSLSGTLNVGKSALAVTQAAIQTTGNNIAGASDPNYSRQVASVGSARGRSAGDGIFLGTGIELAGVERQVDEALNRRLDAAAGESAAARERLDWLRQAEAAFNELTDADVSTAMTRYFNAWSSLANNPGDAALRQSVISESEALASEFNRLYDRLDRLADDVDLRVEAYAKDADRVLDEIASLNTQIQQAEGAGGGGSANALRDRRDALVGEVAGLAGTRAILQPDGSLNVYAGTEPLVIAGDSRGITLEKRNDATSGKVLTTVTIDNGGGPAPLNGGQLAGAVEAQQTIRDTLARLDAVAQSLKHEVNTLHASGQGTRGYDTVSADVRVDDTTVALDLPAAGVEPPPQNGSFVVHLRDKASGNTTSTIISVPLDGTTGGTSLDDLTTAIDAIGGVSASVSAGQLTISADAASQEVVFSDDTSKVLASLGIATFFTGQGAADLGVNQAIKDDPGKLAASRDNTPGGNGNALAMASLADQGLDALAGGTIAQAFDATLFEVSAGVRTATTEADAAGAIEETLIAQRQALSGVSLDEEAVQLLRYQRSYQGAARVVAAVDEMMQTLLDLV